MSRHRLNFTFLQWILVVLLTCAAERHGFAERPDEVTFQGQIDTIPFQLRWMKFPDGLMGTLFYEKYGIELPITATQSSNGEVIIQERDREKGTLLSTFEGHWGSPREIVGTWTKVGGSQKKPFAMKLGAYEYRRVVKPFGNQDSSFLMPDENAYYYGCFDGNGEESEVVPISYSLRWSFCQYARCCKVIYSRTQQNDGSKVQLLGLLRPSQTGGTTTQAWLLLEGSTDTAHRKIVAVANSAGAEHLGFDEIPEGQGYQVSLSSTGVQITPYRYKGRDFEPSPPQFIRLDSISETTGHASSKTPDSFVQTIHRQIDEKDLRGAYLNWKDLMQNYPGDNRICALEGDILFEHQFQSSDSTLSQADVSDMLRHVCESSGEQILWERGLYLFNKKRFSRAQLYFRRLLLSFPKGQYQKEAAHYDAECSVQLEKSKIDHVTYP